MRNCNAKLLTGRTPGNPNIGLQQRFAFAPHDLAVYERNSKIEIKARLQRVQHVLWFASDLPKIP